MSKLYDALEGIVLAIIGLLYLVGGGIAYMFGWRNKDDG